MELGLTVTIAIVVLTMSMFAFANWRGRRPAEPLKVRMINYHVVQIVCAIVLLYMFAHLMTLLMGQPATPVSGGTRF